MKLKGFVKKNENWILPLLVLFLFGICVGIRFDYYYDLNDDVLMKDILAGVYTGTPEGHNIQMLWLISAMISLFYRICRALPWYGLFLCGCHFGCFFLILKRSMRFARTFAGKLGVAVTELLLFSGLFLSHLVYAQYTVTCTLLGGTAAFLFYTTDRTLPAKEFIKKNIPSVLLVFLAYLVRSEMLLLVLPMICAAGVAKWGSEEKIFTKENAVKYLTVIGLILAGLLIGETTHRIAYGSKQWRTFTEFFDNRTELYDFQAPPSYEEHQEFYDSIGLSESEKVLLDNYNFGMDEEIDEKLIGQIAVYAGQNKSAEAPVLERLPGRLRFYVYRLTRGRNAVGSDYPWNYAVILGYAAVLLLAIPGKGNREKTAGKKSRRYLGNGLGAAWKLLLLFCVRTSLWMFILMRGRDPERITHSLYLMELCILGAMLFTEWKELVWGQLRWESGAAGATYAADRRSRGIGTLILAVFAGFSLTVLPESIQMVDIQQTQRAEVNAPYQELYQYLSSEENAGNFYFIDVYSSVAYSEKMFDQVDNSLDNYDIMGGWACKSPLQRKKLAAFGITDMELALKSMDQVFFVRRSSEDMQWLFDYYEGHGTPVTAVLVQEMDGFEIYQIKG